MATFDYESLILDIPDHPKRGVVFKDITPLLASAEGFNAIVKDIADHYRDQGITKVVGAEARGFMIGAPVAHELGAGGLVEQELRLVGHLVVGRVEQERTDGLRDLGATRLAQAHDLAAAGLKVGSQEASLGRLAAAVHALERYEDAALGTGCTVLHLDLSFGGLTFLL